MENTCCHAQIHPRGNTQTDHYNYVQGCHAEISLSITSFPSISSETGSSVQFYAHMHFMPSKTCPGSETKSFVLAECFRGRTSAHGFELQLQVGAGALMVCRYRTILFDLSLCLDFMFKKLKMTNSKHFLPGTSISDFEVSGCPSIKSNGSAAEQPNHYPKWISQFSINQLSEADIPSQSWGAILTQPFKRHRPGLQGPSHEPLPRSLVPTGSQPSLSPCETPSAV